MLDRQVGPVSRFYRREPRLPWTAWSVPFALAMVVLFVEVLFVAHLMTAGQRPPLFEFLYYQDFVYSWTDGGTLERGIAFELMKVNVVLVVYLWVMSRTTHPRREAVHRWSLIGAVLVLAGLNLLLAKTALVLTRPGFTLVPVEF